jgi:hypothetical protein
VLATLWLPGRDATTADPWLVEASRNAVTVQCGGELHTRYELIAGGN